MVFLREKFSYHLFMATKAPRKPIPFDCPATYKIIVQGRIDQTWSDRLEGMTIYQVTEVDSSPVTTLAGWLSDQTALDGVLNSLHDLRLTILLVDRLDNG